jgi:hypothetical protein
MRFGRHPSRYDYRTPRFAIYASGLAAPPPSFDSTARVEEALALTVPDLFPMDGNDVYGDCTIAARAHADTIWNAFDRTKDIPTRAWCLNLYFELTGGVDSGLDPLTVLKNWQKTKADEILGYVAIDPSDHVHMQQAMVLFGCVYVGVQCTTDMVQQFDAHQPWTPGTLINDGHCVVATGYIGSAPTDMLNVLTWGNAQKAQWAWWDECAGGGRGEAYAIVPKAAQNAAFAPGFDVQQLLADLQAVAN